MDFFKQYQAIRAQSLAIVRNLKEEDYVPQPIVDVSPTKWHLAHTTWFFETFLLKPYLKGYTEYHTRYSFLFNSYYNTIGDRTFRADRGNLTRPTVDEILSYRTHVDHFMETLLEKDISEEVRKTLLIGFNHEQQHQELILTDIKYVLGHNPLFPALFHENNVTAASEPVQPIAWLPVEEAIYKIGYDGADFHFDNEKPNHKAYIHGFEIADRLVTNGEYLEFVKDNGYREFNLWLEEGWAWVTNQQLESPLYWHKEENQWMNYTLQGYQPLDPNAPVSHVSYYEADAYARWLGWRLPTEFEWEAASKHYGMPTGNLFEGNFCSPKRAGHGNNQMRGDCWEWTCSAYLPYPNFKPVKGALGEYNGKFMINQMVLRGGSCATPKGHERFTYRNFFHPDKQWQFSGIRLAKPIN